MRISDWSSDVCSSDLQNSGRGRNGAQGGKRQEEIAEEDAPVITATAKPKRRADKKSKASRQSTEASTNASSANITLHVSSELLGQSVDMSLEPHVCVAEFIRYAIIATTISSRPCMSSHVATFLFLFLQECMCQPGN